MPRVLPKPMGKGYFEVKGSNVNTLLMVCGKSLILVILEIKADLFPILNDDLPFFAMSYRLGSLKLNEA